jgi:hypothetical protein
MVEKSKKTSASCSNPTRREEVAQKNIRTTRAMKEPMQEAEAQLDRVSIAGQNALVAMARLHSQFFSSALEINADLLDFACARIDEDLRVNNRLAKCDDTSEAMETVSGFYQKAFWAYVAQANNVLMLSAGVARGSILQSQDEALNMMHR